MEYRARSRGPGNRVGVRELRQNLSVYLERVKDGETLEVTEHGRPVALLGPRPPDHGSALDRLLEEGLAKPARGDLLDLGPPIEPPAGTSTGSDVLLRMRDEERG